MTVNRRNLLTASALGLAACAPNMPKAETTEDKIKAAQSLLGVSYSGKERAQLAGQFEDQNEGLGVDA